MIGEAKNCLMSGWRIRVVRLIVAGKRSENGSEGQ